MVFTLLLLLLPFGEILDYWLGPEDQRLEAPGEKAVIWFHGGSKVDEEITERFSQSLHDARYGKLAHLKATPKGRLALVILLDQFSRNIYRGSPEAFACDSLALDIVLEGIAQNIDQKLYPVERLFFYMPLQHAEDKEIQKLSIAKYEQLLEECDENFKPIAERSLSFARLHKNIVDRFGRFPHRSGVLSRESSDTEIAFLQEENPSF